MLLILDDNLENADVLDTFKNILDIVNSCENLSADFVKEGRIENASDYLIDAQILKMSHDLMGNTATKMGNSDFSEDELIASLKNMFAADSGDSFERLAEIAVKCCKTSYFFVPMLGTFDFDAGPRPEKLRKERLRSKNQVGEARAPENVKQLTKSDQGAEKINIVRAEIQKIFRKRKTECLPYYELICDPSSFMQSVDIAFQISFLVRDGVLGLRKVEGEPHVFLFDPKPSSKQGNQARDSDTVQCVMTFDTKLWNEKIQKYKIGSPLLKIGQENDEEEQDESMDD